MAIPSIRPPSLASCRTPAWPIWRPSRPSASRPAPRPTCSTAGSRSPAPCSTSRSSTCASLTRPTTRSRAWPARRWWTASSSAPSARSPTSGTCSPATAICSRASRAIPISMNSGANFPTRRRTTSRSGPPTTSRPTPACSSMSTTSPTSSIISSISAPTRCRDRAAGRRCRCACGSEVESVDDRCSLSVCDPHLLPPPFRGREEQAARALRRSKRPASRRLFPPPERARNKVGVANTNTRKRAPGITPMMVHVPKVLTPDQVARCRDVMTKAAWVDGRVTAGHQSAKVKHNLQLPETAPEARELGDMVLDALGRSPLFMSAVLPKQVFPPLFNRYDAGMKFGSHIDNGIRAHPASPVRIRTDVSSTLFISGPEDYDGGELVVEDTYGTHSVKLPAGDLIVYPASSLHHVTPITRGARIACFFWTQSLVRDDTQRALLFDLDMAIRQLTRDYPDHASLVSLTGCYHNLLRQWAEA